MASPLIAPSLFAGVRLGPYALRNRIVMAPMTRGRAGAGDVPSALAPTYYAQRARAGLIISEAAHVAPEGISCPGTPGLFAPAQVGSWRAISEAVHGEGGLIFLQLCHAGRLSHPLTQPGGVRPVAPSALAPQGTVFTRAGRLPFVTPRELDANEVAELIEAFTQAARLALEAGFDGVDIHAANGYLIDQFLRDGSNQRRDRYGGTIAHRARFLLEVVEAAAGVWGFERVGVRLSPLAGHNSMQDTDPDAMARYIAGSLSELGIAYLHLVQPGHGHSMDTAQRRAMAGVVRAHFRGPVMVDGGRDKGSALDALAEAGAQLVAFATPFISNPDLVDRLERNLPLASPDPHTFYEGGARGYTDYPRIVVERPHLLPNPSVGGSSKERGSQTCPGPDAATSSPIP